MSPSAQRTQATALRLGLKVIDVGQSDRSDHASQADGHLFDIKDGAFNGANNLLAASSRPGRSGSASSKEIPLLAISGRSEWRLG